MRIQLGGGMEWSIDFGAIQEGLSEGSPIDDMNSAIWYASPSTDIAKDWSTTDRTPQPSSEPREDEYVIRRLWEGFFTSFIVIGLSVLGNWPREVSSIKPGFLQAGVPWTYAIWNQGVLEHFHLGHAILDFGTAAVPVVIVLGWPFVRRNAAELGPG